MTSDFLNDLENRLWDVINTLLGEALLLNLTQNLSVMHDWKKRQQSRAAVQLCIEETLDKLPTAYGDDIWQSKCQNVYQHIFDNYKDATNNTYARVV